LAFDSRIKLFIVLAGVFVTCLVVGDIIGGKLVETTIAGYPFTITVGMIPFPVTFLITDLLNEFYGKRMARFVTWLGFGMAVLAYVFIYVAAEIPIAAMTNAATWNGVNHEAFSRVFTGSQRMIIASLTAYLIAQLVDISVFHLLKRLTKNRLLWLRATGSTVISQLIDTIVINVVAWGGILTTDKLLTVIGSSYVMKILIAVGLTPLIYAGHAIIERVLSLRPLSASGASDAELSPPA
jgi:queuosine precursor transporter